MSDDGRTSEIRPLAMPDGTTRIALMRAYRDGLRIDPVRAWHDVLALAGALFPDTGPQGLRKMLLLSLGLFGVADRTDRPGDEPPNMEGYMPCLVRPDISLRLRAVLMPE